MRQIPENTAVPRGCARSLREDRIVCAYGFKHLDWSPSRRICNRRREFGAWSLGATAVPGPSARTSGLFHGREMTRHFVCSVTLLVALGSLLCGHVLAQSDWTELTGAPTVGRYNDVYFVTPETGWVVNGDGEIYRTTDSGETWYLQFRKASAHFRSVGFISKTRGFAGNVGVGESVHIGAGATVIQNLRIGKDALVAAGAVVTEDVAVATIVRGVPARVVTPS